MSSLVIFGVLMLLLFGSAYLTKRRFGILALALAGGSLLVSVLGDTAGLLLAAEGSHLDRISPENLAVIIVTLLPALLLLLHGPRYHSSLPRLGASVAFVLLALALIIHPVQPLLTAHPAGLAIYRYIMQSRELIISAGIGSAILDIFFIKGSSHAKPGPKH
jgi:hypothetical protein